MALTNEKVLDKINSFLPNAIVQNEVMFDTLVVELKHDNDTVHKVIEFLKNDSELQTNFLTLLGAVHYPNDKDREIAVVYHLHSLVNNYRIRIKTFLSGSNPHIKTITDLYDSANWMERETFDFYGVIFDKHPNLKRILNEDDMDYYPLRKEYKLEDATREDKDDRFFGR
jgi:NADH-quinone oxidoreductase subunit C